MPRVIFPAQNEILAPSGGYRCYQCVSASSRICNALSLLGNFLFPSKRKPRKGYGQGFRFDPREPGWFDTEG
jgi:hypothetical protein